MEPRKTAAGSGYTNIFPLYLLVFEFSWDWKLWNIILKNIEQPRPLLNAAARGEYAPVCAHLEHRCVGERGLAEAAR